MRIRAGAHYTYVELALFAFSIIGILTLAIYCWGFAGKRFAAGWIGATALTAIVHMAFDWFQFFHAAGAPWQVGALAIAGLNLLVAFTIHGAAFLAMFAGAVWLSHRSSGRRFGTFALAGSIAMMAQYIVLGFNLDYLALTWWPWRTAEVAIGAVAGVAFYYIARKTKGAPSVAA